MKRHQNQPMLKLFSLIYLSIRGLWYQQIERLLDICVIDITNAQFNVNRTMDVVLASAEWE